MNWRRGLRRALVALVAACAALYLPACSHRDADEAMPASPEIIAAIKARRANYKEIGGAFKTINDELKSSAPDYQSIGSAAREILTRATNQLRYFPPGSGPESHEKTRAKSAIWADLAEFTRSHATFVAGARKLADAVGASPDRAALSKLRAALGDDCKTCHDRFRAPE